MVLTFSLSRNEQIVEVIDDLPCVKICVLANGLGHADPRLLVQGGQPLAVDVDAILDGLVLLQGQREPKANDVHTPPDLFVSRQNG